ncbi:MAG TPA: DNA-binding response regulator [Xanthomonadales bacterium]|nr:DNA-binding response regulator [Xanthomonadales bacterium]
MKILIVDDEPLARERLRQMLAALADVQVVGEADNGLRALELAETLRPDAILLDISMPVMDGLEAARHLAGQQPRPAVVFCTAYDAHALAAFEAAAVDYLVKPVRRERLFEALDRVARIGPSTLPGPDGRPRSHLCARLRGSLRLIPIDDIRYLHAEEKYVVVHHARGEDLVEDSLKTLESEFGDRFLRIHRSCLIAREQLTELRRSPDGRVFAILRDGSDSLEVSRRCVPALREKIRT